MDVAIIKNVVLTDIWKDDVTWKHLKGETREVWNTGRVVTALYPPIRDQQRTNDRISLKIISSRVHTEPLFLSLLSTMFQLSPTCVTTHPASWGCNTRKFSFDIHSQLLFQDFNYAPFVANKCRLLCKGLSVIAQKLSELKSSLHFQYTEGGPNKFNFTRSKIKQVQDF